MENKSSNVKVLDDIEIITIDEVDAVLCGSDFNETVPELSIKMLVHLPNNAQYTLTTAHLTRAHTKVLNRLFPKISIIRQASPNGGGGADCALVPTLQQIFHYFSGGISVKLKNLTPF